MIVKSYEYLFYRLYKWSEHINGEDYNHKMYAVLGLSFPFVLNLITLFIMYDIFIVDIAFPALSPPTLIMLGILHIFIHYAYFTAGNRYMKVINRYRHEGPSRAKRGGVVVMLYVVGSFFAMVFFGFVGAGI